jgi:TRAP-type mannitol/chloroaromatic compound transport system permease small subunit
MQPDTQAHEEGGAVHGLVRAIDWLTDLAGGAAKWALLLACVISGLNAIVRYAFGYSSNGWLEVQWYLFGAGVMLGAAQVFRLNEHVRVDLLYSRYPPRAQACFDIAGTIFFLLPVMGLLAWLAWPIFWQMFLTREMSPNAGGLIRWPAMLMIPLGFALVWLQGIAEIVKRVLWLQGRYEMSMHYEKPLQ